MPEKREEYVEFLKGVDQLDEAAQQLAIIVNDEKFHSNEGKSNHQVTRQLLTH